MTKVAGDFHAARLPARSCRGFSLLEIVLAVVIIAVLLILSLSAISKGRESAKTAACVFRLKELWGTWNIYSMETKGVLYQGTLTWVSVMSRTGSRPLETSIQTQCPATDQNSLDVYYVNQLGWVNEPVGYAANSYALYATPGINSAHQFTEKHSAPLFIDGKVYALSTAAWRHPEQRLGRISFRHSGKANILFLDGHVETLSSQEVLLINPVPL